MKKNVVVFLIAVIIGTLFSLYIFKGIDKTFAIVNGNNYISLYQVGVFKIYDNAAVEASKYISSIIIEDEKLFHVYIGIANDNEVDKAYSNYFDELNIKYYKRRENINNKCLKKINSYENLVKKTFNKDTYFNINKILLEFYKDGCND